MWQVLKIVEKEPLEFFGNDFYVVQQVLEFSDKIINLQPIV